MEIKEFKKYAIDLGYFTAQEVDEFEFMNDGELKDYQIELEENDGDDLSCMDHIRVLFSLKSKISEFEEKLNNKFELLINMNSRDEVENYTTGYKNGHRNGQMELIQWLLNINDEEIKQELR